MIENQKHIFRVAGVIVVYEPTTSLLANINTVINQLDILIIINNGKANNYAFSEWFPNKKIYVEYFPENIGIASGLNTAAKIANQNSMDYLLMMDQDSYASQNLITDYLIVLERINNPKVALISPNFIYKSYIGKNFEADIREIDFAMTSGSFLNLKAYRQIGPFIDELFIDYVDFEYCLRLKKNGFKIIQLKNSFIHHNLGQITGRKFIFKNISVTNHSPERYYYRTRNRFYLYKKYFTSFPIIILKDLIVFFNELLKILLYECQKLKKIKMIIKGFSHFLVNHYGKL